MANVTELGLVDLTSIVVADMYVHDEHLYTVFDRVRSQLSEGRFESSDATILIEEVTKSLGRLQADLARKALTNNNIAQTKRWILRPFLEMVLRHHAVSDGVRKRIAHFLVDYFDPTDVLPDSQYKITQDMFSWHAQNWIKLLARYINKPHVKFLEIGCGDGVATSWLLSEILTHPTASITCVDNFSYHPKQEHYFDWNTGLTKNSYKVVKLRGSSYQILRCLPATSFDFVYVDAHEMLLDGMLSWSLLKPNGIMVFDDYELGRALATQGDEEGYVDPTRREIDSFLALIPGEFVTIHKGYQVIIEKQRR
jgi:predicted O-methyltransferase YrrM